MQNLLQLRLLPVAGGLKNPGEGLKPLLVYSCKTSDDRAVDIKNTAYIAILAVKGDYDFGGCLSPSMIPLGFPHITSYVLSIQALLNTQLTRIKKPLESKSFPRACHTT